jgi:hypothetical protein
MVLRPIEDVSRGCGTGEPVFRSAWSAVERTQRALAAEWWLISQPDHAALSGSLAASFVSPDFPALDPLLARAIEVHDSGWAEFVSETETGTPQLDARGKPLSFIEIAPPDFLRAWSASIERAEQVCPAGGYIVSRHFCGLGRGRLEAHLDGPGDAARLQSFLDREAGRQPRLALDSGRPPAELDPLLAVLQFCDLLSLFLCCGACEPVEFPQCFAGRRVRLLPRDGAFALEPSPFRGDGSQQAGGVSLGVRARRFPSSPTAPNSTTLAFLLW